MIASIAFYLMATVTVVAALLVVTARNPVHSVLWLILAFFSAAGLFVLMGAEFLTMLLVVVYVGAVAVLFLFVVMMLDVDFVRLREGYVRYLPLAAIVAGVLLAEMIMITLAVVQGGVAADATVPAVATADRTNIEAIGRVDSYLGRLLSGIDKLPHAERVNIIIVSDHGQAAYLEEPEALILDELVNIDGASIVEGGSYLFMHFDQHEAGRARNIVETVNNRWKHGRAYTAADAPGQWYVDSNPRFPDVILMPEVGYAVISTARKADKISAGDHGWAPENPFMHGFFIASGPNIKPGVSLDSVNSVDVYPLMLSILGLEGPQSIDGDPSKLSGVLREAH